MRAHAAAAPGRVIDGRLRHDALLEIEWFFGLAETEMSAPSNFGRMLASVSPEGRWRTPEDQAEAACAHHRILDWLRAMPNNEAGVLQAAYEPRRWPTIVQARFRHLTGIAVRLTCALDDWPEDRRLQELMDEQKAHELAKRCSNPERRVDFLNRLQRRAEARLETALNAYLRVRGTRRSVIAGRDWCALTSTPEPRGSR
jgi:hypothetical protein